MNSKQNWVKPENGTTVELIKDNTNDGVEAKGLTTIGKDEDNANSVQ